MKSVQERGSGAARRGARRGAPAESNGSKAAPLQTRAGAEPPLRPRRRPKLIALGVLAVSIGGLGAAALYNTAISEQPVIMVARDLPRGQAITTGDLAVVHLNAAPGISVVAATELDDLIGQTTLRDLAAGSVLPAGAIGVNPLPTGTSVVGLRLPSGRIPAGGLGPGDPVSLVPVQPLSGETDDGIPELPPLAATVSSVPVLASDQAAWLVDVRVAVADARVVTELAATDRLALVLEASA